MLSPAQKNLGGDESSGSDAGSEVGLEPETDRFGFIVTNGSTAGSVGPPPGLVRQREAKWLNIIVQWDRILLKKSSKVKVQCQKGIPASLRAKCWPLLCGATDRVRKEENLYQSLDSQPALQSWVDVIERDLDRQFPFHEMFLSKEGHGQQGLFRVLKAYTQYQPEEGYCQAQGPVAAVLLMNMPAEEAFWCLVQISEQYLPGYYSPLLEGVLFDAAMLTWALKRTCPAIHKHLQQHGVEPLMFATDWLMCLFTRHLPFNTLLRVWDLFFCHGVRVLLQVAVVLVRRVLGRAEQRKQCQGQMETLEKLRGVREEVTEEDNAFITEVCSVPLSVRDLEKQTVKELEKWRKDRPSSTFDPRGRCHGYQMVWARALQSREEKERREREKGNLSVPLARSASTLSLSPSMLHKKWRKGSKVTTGEWEGGGRIVRHLSMGAKEDWRGWTDFHSKKVQEVQEEEDVVSEEGKELKVTGQSEQKEPKQNIPTGQEDEMATVEQGETRTTNNEKSKETDESNILSEQAENTNLEAQPTQGPATEAEGLNSVPRQPSLQENKHTDKNQETEKPMLESEHVENQTTEIHKGVAADTDTEMHKDVQQTLLETVTEVPATANETSPDLETAAKEPIAETNTQEQELQQQDQQEQQEQEEQEQQEQQEQEEQEQQEQQEQEQQEQEQEQQEQEQQEQEQEQQEQEQQEQEQQEQQEQEQEQEQEQQQQEGVIAETEDSSQEDTLEQHESLAETHKEESHTQSETETDALPQTGQVEEHSATQDQPKAEGAQTESEQRADSKTEAVRLVLCSPGRPHPAEGAAIASDTDSEVDIPVTKNRMSEPREANAQCSGGKRDAVASQPTQEVEQRFVSTCSECGDERIQEEETPTETQTMEETTHSTAPPSAPPHGEEVNLTSEPDGKSSSVDMYPTEEPAEQVMQTTEGAVEERTGNAQENVVGEEDVFTPEVKVLNIGSYPQVQDQAEWHNSSLAQTAGHRSSRSSGDFCIRKSSSSRGSKLGRRLSEDLFILPLKTSQSQPMPHEPDVNHTENPGDTDVTDRTKVQEVPERPKRFGLFRRLRREQPTKTRAKETPKLQVPKILIQDFSDGARGEKTDEGEEKLSSRERRRRRRELERKEKEEERLRKKREKAGEKERERRKPQTRGKSFQVQREKGSSEAPPHAKSQTLRYSESYF